MDEGYRDVKVYRESYWMHVEKKILSSRVTTDGCPPIPDDMTF